MPFKKYSLVKYLIVPPMAICFYWAIWYKVTILQTPWFELVNFSDHNLVAFLLLLGIQLIIFGMSYRGKARLAKELNVKSDNPFKNAAPVTRNSDGVKSYFRTRWREWDDSFERILDHIGHSSLPIRIFLKLKRFVYLCCVFLYLALALTSLTNPLFFVLFIITTYAFLENLVWARHHQWAKRQRHDEAR